MWPLKKEGHCLIGVPWYLSLIVIQLSDFVQQVLGPPLSLQNKLPTKVTILLMCAQYSCFFMRHVKVTDQFCPKFEFHLVMPFSSSFWLFKPFLYHTVSWIFGTCLRTRKNTTGPCELHSLLHKYHTDSKAADLPPVSIQGIPRFSHIKLPL